jgi:hypothetical protein
MTFGLDQQAGVGILSLPGYWVVSSALDRLVVTAVDDPGRRRNAFQTARAV